jgi:DNA-directed RNA polymerase subunit beta'
MLAPNNFLSPATGEPILTPSQDMVLGCYYLTANNPTEQTLTDQYFYSFDDVITAYKQSLLHLHTFIWVRCDIEQFNNSTLVSNSNFIEKKIGDRIISVNHECQIKKDLDGNTLQIYLKTTPGRILLNQSFEKA